MAYVIESDNNNLTPVLTLFASAKISAHVTKMKMKGSIQNKTKKADKNCIGPDKF